MSVGPLDPVLDPLAVGGRGRPTPATPARTPIRHGPISSGIKRSGASRSEARTSAPPPASSGTTPRLVVFRIPWWTTPREHHLALDDQAGVGGTLGRLLDVLWPSDIPGLGGSVESLGDTGVSSSSSSNGNGRWTIQRTDTVTEPLPDRQGSNASSIIHVGLRGWGWGEDVDRRQRDIAYCN